MSFAQWAQRVLEEFAAFNSWFKKSNKGDTDANPPRPRARRQPFTLHRDEEAERHQDSKHDKLRLSKGFNLKTHHSEFILTEDETRPDVTVEKSSSVSTARSVASGERYSRGLVGDARE
jgi:putative transposase